MSERVEISIENHVAEVMLNRPEKFNALDLDMFHALDAAGRRVDEESSVRAVVLHGAGENFCAGIDVEALQSGGEAAVKELLGPVEGTPVTLVQRAAYAWRELRVPVICALRGFVVGGGLQIAMGADVRIAAADTRLSIMESKWGLVPDMAISSTLFGSVPEDVIKELAYTARIFAPDEGVAHGMITRIEEDPLTAARELAAEIAQRSPDAMRGIKRLVNEAPGLSELDALALEARIQAGIIGRPNQVEAVRANLEKRPAKFID